jgi:hypothetical protein
MLTKDQWLARLRGGSISVPCKKSSNLLAFLQDRPELKRFWLGFRSLGLHVEGLGSQVGGGMSQVEEVGSQVNWVGSQVDGVRSQVKEVGLQVEGIGSQVERVGLRVE